MGKEPDRQLVNVRLSRDVHKRLRHLSIEVGETMAELIRICVDAHLPILQEALESNPLREPEPADERHRRGIAAMKKAIQKGKRGKK